MAIGSKYEYLFYDVHSSPSFSRQFFYLEELAIEGCVIFRRGKSCQRNIKVFGDGWLVCALNASLFVALLLRCFCKLGAIQEFRPPAPHQFLMVATGSPSHQANLYVLRCVIVWVLVAPQ